MQSVFEIRSLRRAFAVVLAIGLVACGDDDDETHPDAAAPDADAAVVDAAVADAADADAGDADAAIGDGKRRYAISTTLITDDNTTSYVLAVDSLQPGTEIDLKHALEVGGSARAYGPDDRNVVYLTSSEDGTMTEVTFDRDGAPAPGRSVSFAQLGVTGTTGGNINLHISPTKAYFVSQDILEIVVWNPKEMAVTTTVPLPTELAPGAVGVVFYPRPIVVDGKLIVIATPYDSHDFAIGTVVVVVDTASDAIVSGELDTRCHDLLQSAVDAKGDRYFGSSDYAAAQHFLEPDAPAPCMLRIRAGKTAFDPDWSRTLTTDLDTPLWTGVTQGAKGHMFVQGTSVDTPIIAKTEDAYELTIAQPWDWYALADGDAAPVKVSTDLMFPPSFPPMPVDGDDYVTVWDDKDTTLVNLTAGEMPEPGLVIPGFVFNIVRIR